MSLIVLAGDVGGTGTRLAVYRLDGKVRQTLAQADFPSQSFALFEHILDNFLAESDVEIEVACFGVAGPVRDGIARVTNLPWQISVAGISQRYAIRQVFLINDLEANAWGLSALAEDDYLVLQQGESQQGNAAIIAAGTGLGEAGLYHDGCQLQPFATEGGHADFSPNSSQDIEFLRYLKKIYSHVSWEQVLSGHGLVHIHNFLCLQQGGKTANERVEEMQQDDAASVISQCAAAGDDEVCVQALEMFVTLFGAEAGNLALKMMARGGLFIGGGIASKNSQFFTQEHFMQAFLAKGRMQPLLETMPVKLILNNRTALYGPALYAGCHAACVGSNENGASSPIFPSESESC
ncbi:MAG: glucokinase [Gammaproteobacteria bacterium]